MKHVSAFFDPKEKWHKRFAWFPKRSSISDRLIWLQFYWRVEIYMDSWGRVPIYDLTWTRILSENEALVQQIKYPKE